MENKKMLVFDIDGTLYDDINNEVPLSTIKAIEKAKAKGHIFVVATGRAHYALGKAIKSLKPDYIISVNGGVVSDSENRIITHEDFSKEDVDDIVAFANQEEAGLIFKFIDCMYIYHHPEKMDCLEEPKKSEIGHEVFMDCLSQDHHGHVLPQGASMHADPLHAQEFFNEHTRIQMIPYSYDGFDVMLKGMNKSIGLKHLMEYLKIDPSEVVTFGDNYNDMEMMKCSGYKVAMGNAVDDIKNMADYVTKASNEDGIDVALKHLGIIE